MSDDRRPFSLENRRVWVAGHRGMVGAALIRRLEREKCEILTVGRDRVDLRRQDQVELWVAENRPDAVFLAAARVGGILANSTLPAEFIHDNLAIATTVIDACHRHDVAKLMFLGTSCIYPRLADQPIREQALLTGELEPTNEWYAIAKIAGLKLCQAYRRQYGRDYVSVMPCNLYGQGDTYDLKGSHVVPALLMKMHQAKVENREAVEIWGTGNARREFLEVDDLADACVYLMKSYSGEEHVNVGFGTDVSIRELAQTIAKVVGYAGRFEFDATKPDGMARKLLDVTRLKSLGWEARTTLEAGLTKAYAWYLENRV